MADLLTQAGVPDLQLREAGAELERRLRAGEIRAVEAVLAAYPRLAADADSALQLVYEELILRERLGQQPGYEEYYARFPQWQAELRKSFDIHEALVRHNPDAAALAAPPPPARLAAGAPGPGGDRRYELLAEIGRGGMGVVYRARQPGLDRVVALKMILAAELAGADDQARFRTEAETAARLQHPNIVQVYEVGEQDGRPFLALEYVAGGSLADHLKGTPLPYRASARLIETLAWAVQYAHEHGVLHRDLKPANILMQSADGRVSLAESRQGSGDSPENSASGTRQAAVPKITDFGLAKRLPGSPGVSTARDQTQTGDVLGTPSYMAPEQAEGKLNAIGPATDVYALGAILYEALTGRPPFRGETPLETLVQLREQEPVAPGRLSPKVPRDLETICLKCLRKEPARRYASAAALAADLQRFLAGEPIQARPISAVERTVKWARRRPLVAGLFLAIALLGTVSLVIVSWQWRATVAALGEKEKARQDAVVNEDRARRAAEVAQRRLLQIEKGNEILASIFQDLDPLAEEKEGKSLRVILGARLDQATAQLDAEAVGDPLTVARLQQALGSSHLGLSHPDKAITLFTSALQTRAALLDPTHPDTLSTMNSLACAYLDAGQFHDAITLAEKTLKVRQETLGVTHPQTLVSLNNLAAAYQDAGRLRAALPLFEQSLRLTRETRGPTNADTLLAMSNLAAAYRKLDRLPEALPLFEAAWKLRTETLGPTHPLTLRVMSTLAATYRQAGRLPEALPLCEQNLKLRTETLGPTHRETLGAMGELAGAYRAAGRLPEALPLFEHSLKLRQATLGPTHPDTLLALNNLATAYQDAGRLDEAVALFEKTLQLTRETLGATHPDTLPAMNNLAQTYREAGQLARSVPLAEETLQLAREVLGPTHAYTLHFLGNLAKTYLAARQPEKALSLLPEFLADQRKRLGPDDPRLASELAQVGLELLHAQRYAEAEPLLRECLTIREKKQPDAWTTFNAMAMLGRSLLGQRKYALAEPLLVQGYQGMNQRTTQIPATHKVRLAETLKRLVELYDAWNKPAEAARWREELGPDQKP